MAYSASNEKQVKTRQKKEKLEREQELEDLKFILGTDAGTRFFKKFFEKARMFSTTFTGNSNTFFLEGHRNFALQYFNDICEVAPEKIAQLMLRKSEDINTDEQGDTE